MELPGVDGMGVGSHRKLYTALVELQQLYVGTGLQDY
jgi:hypothetical protein